MRFNFWRGIIAGSLLGALFSMLVGKPVRKPKEKKLWGRIKRLCGQEQERSGF